MKKILVPVLVGLFTCASVFADPAPAPTATPAAIHFEQVNGVLATILKEAIALETPNGDNYSFITPFFDPARSSLENESIAYSFSAAVKNAPWSNGTGTFNISVDTYLKTDRVSPVTGVTGTVTSAMNLDLLELARYSAKKMIAYPIQYDSDFVAREQDIVTRMSTVANMTEFSQLILDSRSLAQDITDRDTTRAMSNLDCIRQLTCGNVGRDQWGNPEMDQASYLYQQIRIGELIQTKSISLSNSVQFDGSSAVVTMDPQAFLADDDTLGNYKTSVVTFTATSVKVTASGFAQVKIADLDRLHRDFAREFNLVQINDPAKHTRLQQAGRDILVSFRRIMAGQIPSKITPPFDSDNN